jgi:hypothetical protein
VPLAVDRYGDSFLLTPSTDRLESRTRAENEDWLDLMARTASEVLSVPLQNVFIQGRPREPKAFAVREDGILYEARLPEGRGFDPALRVLRRWLKKESLGKENRNFSRGGGEEGSRNWW